MTVSIDELTLADWRRRVAALYAEVRRLIRASPDEALQLWRQERDRLYREHPQSPVPEAQRATFQALHFPPDPALRFEADVIPDGSAPGGGGEGAAATSATPARLPASAPAGLPASTGGMVATRRIGWVEIPFPEGSRRLAVHWMEGYAGGLFLPFRDATNGTQTYGGGRYLLDGAKGADLGGDPERGTLLLDFNFAFQPSCAFDPRWSCPLAPVENRLDVAVRAGERLA